jgi:hypothetical protein
MDGFKLRIISPKAELELLQALLLTNISTIPEHPINTEDHNPVAG